MFMSMGEPFLNYTNLEFAIEALEAYLDACKERIDDRLDRNVMGDLKE